jgi:uncharacterized protein
MLITDTGPLVALLNSKDKHHAACADLFRRYRQPIIIPAPVVTEVAQFLEFEPGPQVEAAFLDALARRELLVEATTDGDFARMAQLVRQYSDFPLGTADASVVAVAERLGITKVATIDREHFHAVKPMHCGAFELLPAGLVVEKRPRKAKRGHDAKH